MRDLKEEYKNSINEDIPDLWNRIEPNLKEKTTASHEKIHRRNRFFQIAIPVAAACCVLLIGGNVILLSKKSSEPTAEEAGFDSASYVDDSSYDDATAAEAMEEAAECETEAQAEDAMANSSLDDASSKEQQSASVQKNAGKKSNAAIGGATVTYKSVTYLAVENSDVDGYESILTFQTADGEIIRTYATEAMLSKWNTNGFSLDVETFYDIVVEQKDSILVLKKLSE